MGDYPELYVPAGTTVEEHDIVAAGPALLGPAATITLGVRASAAVIGHDSTLSRPLETDGDFIAGRGVSIDDLVVAGGSGGLAAEVTVTGAVRVGGTLTVAETAVISDSFVADAGTAVGDPPAATLLLGVFGRHLLRGGPLTPPPPFVVPPGGTITDDRWVVETPATIGQGCRIHGNISATTLTVGPETTIFGSLQTTGDLTVEAGATIHGDITADTGHVIVAEDAHIRGTVTGRTARIAPTAAVDGRIRAADDVTFES